MEGTISIKEVAQIHQSNYLRPIKAATIVALSVLPKLFYGFNIFPAPHIAHAALAYGFSMISNAFSFAADNDYIPIPAPIEPYVNNLANAFLLSPTFVVNSGIGHSLSNKDTIALGIASGMILGGVSDLILGQFIFDCLTKDFNRAYESMTDHELVDLYGNTLGYYFKFLISPFPADITLLQSIAIGAGMGVINTAITNIFKTEEFDHSTFGYEAIKGAFYNVLYDALYYRIGFDASFLDESIGCGIVEAVYHNTNQLVEDLNLYDDSFATTSFHALPYEINL